MALHSDDLSVNTEKRRIIDATPTNRQEEQFEYALRPKTLDEYVGQDKVREQLSIFIQAAKSVAMRWIMPCCLVRQVWAKPLWQILSHTKWA